MARKGHHYRRSHHRRRYGPYRSAPTVTLGRHIATRVHSFRFDVQPSFMQGHTNYFDKIIFRAAYGDAGFDTGNVQGNDGLTDFFMLRATIPPPVGTTPGQVDAYMTFNVGVNFLHLPYMSYNAPNASPNTFDNQFCARWELFKPYYDAFRFDVLNDPVSALPSDTITNDQIDVILFPDPDVPPVGPMVGFVCNTNIWDAIESSPPPGIQRHRGAWSRGPRTFSISGVPAYPQDLFEAVSPATPNAQALVSPWWSTWVTNQADTDFRYTVSRYFVGIHFVGFNMQPGPDPVIRFYRYRIRQSVYVKFAVQSLDTGHNFLGRLLAPGGSARLCVPGGITDT